METSWPEIILCILLGFAVLLILTLIAANGDNIGHGLLQQDLIEQQLDRVETKLDKLDQLETKLNQLGTKLNQLLIETTPVKDYWTP